MNPPGGFICGGCIPGVIANLFRKVVFQVTSVATAGIRMDAGIQVCPLQKAVSAAAGSPPPPKVGCTTQYEFYIGIYSRVCFRLGLTPGNDFTVGGSLDSTR